MAKSRSELEKIIKRGESVIVKGDGGSRIVTTIEDLPSEVELAGDDIVRKQHAIGDIEAEIARLLKQKEAAQKATVSLEKESKPEDKPEDKPDDKDKSSQK